MPFRPAVNFESTFATTILRSLRSSRSKSTLNDVATALSNKSVLSTEMTGLMLKDPSEAPSLEDKTNEPWAFHGTVDTNDLIADAVDSEQKSALRSESVAFVIASETRKSASAASKSNSSGPSRNVLLNGFAPSAAVNALCGPITMRELLQRLAVVLMVPLPLKSRTSSTSRCALILR